MTIRELYDKWLPIKSHLVKQSTLATYVMIFEKRILPKFGETEYATLRMTDLQGWIFKLMESGLSTKTTKDIITAFKTLLHWAEDEYELPMVPGRRILMYPSKETSMASFEAYTSNEQARLLLYLQQNPSFINLAIMIALCTGLRIGEICGLRFCDIDTDKKTLTVNRTLERTYKVSDSGELDGTQLLFQTPKTVSSLREIPLPKQIITLVKSIQPMVMPAYYVSSGSLKPIEPRTLRVSFNKLCQEAGVRRMRFHGLRHSFATRLLANKVDIKTISSLLGHSDVKITMNTYMHPSDDMKRLAISTVNKIFK